MSSDFDKLQKIFDAFAERIRETDDLDERSALLQKLRRVREHLDELVQELQKGAMPR